MSKWRKTEIGKFAKIQGGFAFNSSLYQEEGVPLVRIGNLGNGKLSFSDSVYLSPKIFEQAKNFQLKKNDILIGLTGDLGKIARVKESDLPALLNQRVGRVLLSAENIDGDFIYQFLTSEIFQTNLAVFFVGGAQANVSPKQIESITINLPSEKLDQTKIVAVLSSVDKAIEQTEKLIEKQKRIKRGLLHELLTKGIDENGAIRFEATHEFKDSPLGRIPKDWEVCKIDELKESITSGSRGWAKYYSPEGDIFLRIGNLTRENINLRLENIIRVKPPEGNEGIRTALQEDDILISITADLGIIGIIPKDFGNAYINQHIALVRLDKNKCLPRWAAYYLASYTGQQQFEKLNESGAKAGLNLPTVASLKVAIPKRIEEQITITHQLNKYISMINKQIIKRNKLEAIKKGLMQDLLTENAESRISNLL